MAKNNFFLLIFLLIIHHKTEGQGRSEVVFKGAVFNPMFASGHMFEADVRPDGEFGFSLGVGMAYIKDEKWFLMTSLSTYFQRYHFHYIEDSQGYFYSAYFSGAFSLYRKIDFSPRYKNIILYAGTAINALPFISEKTGAMSLGGELYKTSARFKEKVYPEAAIGIGRQIWNGKVIWLLSVHAAIPKNYLFAATIYPATGMEYAQKNFRDVKFMYSIDYFPFINRTRKSPRKSSIYFNGRTKRKKDINDCPVK